MQRTAIASGALRQDSERAQAPVDQQQAHADRGEPGEQESEQASDGEPSAQLRAHRQHDCADAGDPGEETGEGAVSCPRHESEQQQDL